VRTEDVERAVAAARRRFDEGSWANASPVRTQEEAAAPGALIERHKVEFALLETLDMGKPIGDSMSFDVDASVRCFEWTAEAIDKVFDQVAPTGQNELGMITHEPLGVVAAIVPWNFPLLMAAWKVAPALATGNSVLLKPSEKSPLSACAWPNWSPKPAFPTACSTCCRASARPAAKRWRCTWTSTGWCSPARPRSASTCCSVRGRSNMKRAYMECGGKSPNIVFADAPDLQAAATAAAGAIFYNQGEVCTAASALLVERSIKDEFLAMVLEAGKGMQPRHPLEPER
jgi:gamma-glutamyl-gamma-aminobutyraldehyde dehydrogenase